MTMNEQRTASQGLRELADYLERHPEVKMEYERIILFVQTKEELASIARTAGPFDKRWYGDWFELARSFGPIDLSINIEREKVCRKVETVKTVTRPKFVKTDEMETVEVTDVSWECQESILQESQPCQD
jgi:hypothetical protein